MRVNSDCGPGCSYPAPQGMACYFVTGVKGGTLSHPFLEDFMMATITFDTLKFVERLKLAGVSEEQAKAEVEVLTLVSNCINPCYT